MRSYFYKLSFLVLSLLAFVSSVCAQGVTESECNEYGVMVSMLDADNTLKCPTCKLGERSVEKEQEWEEPNQLGSFECEASGDTWKCKFDHVDPNTGVTTECQVRYEFENGNWGAGSVNESCKNQGITAPSGTVPTATAGSGGLSTVPDLSGKIAAAVKSAADDCKCKAECDKKTCKMKDGYPKVDEDEGIPGIEGAEGVTGYRVRRDSSALSVLTVAVLVECEGACEKDPNPLAADIVAEFGQECKLIDRDLRPTKQVQY